MLKPTILLPKRPTLGEHAEFSRLEMWRALLLQPFLNAVVVRLLKRTMIERSHPQVSIRRQCGLLGLNRSSRYYPPARETEENLRLMRRTDQQYTRTPF